MSGDIILDLSQHQSRLPKNMLAWELEHLTIVGAEALRLPKHTFQPGEKVMVQVAYMADRSRSTTSTIAEFAVTKWIEDFSNILSGK